MATNLFNIDFSKPEAVNEKGTKFWKLQCLTDRANRTDTFGTTLKGWRVLLAQLPDAEGADRSFLLLDNKDRTVEMSTSYEHIGLMIAVNKMLKRSKKKKGKK